METKEFKIQIPEGYEIDEENSTFECIKLKKKVISYLEVLDKFDVVIPTYISASSFEHDDKIRAINRLLFVAKYLNEGWVPDFKDVFQRKHTFIINNDKLEISEVYDTNISIVYFKSRELAQKAIEILGEDIKQALSVDY